MIQVFDFSFSLINRLIWAKHLVTGIPLGHTSVHHHMVLHPQTPSGESIWAKRLPVAVSLESKR